MPPPSPSLPHNNSSPPVPHIDGQALIPRPSSLAPIPCPGGLAPISFPGGLAPILHPGNLACAPQHPRVLDGECPPAHLTTTNLTHPQLRCTCMHWKVHPFQRSSMACRFTPLRWSLTRLTTSMSPPFQLPGPCSLPLWARWGSRPCIRTYGQSRLSQSHLFSAPQHRTAIRIGPTISWGTIKSACSCCTLGVQSACW